MSCISNQNADSEKNVNIFNFFKSLFSKNFLDLSFHITFVFVDTAEIVDSVRDSKRAQSVW